jgi:hypothetical protein
MRQCDREIGSAAIKTAFIKRIRESFAGYRITQRCGSHLRSRSDHDRQTAIVRISPLVSYFDPAATPPAAPLARARVELSFIAAKRDSKPAKGPTLSTVARNLPRR